MDWFRCVLILSVVSAASVRAHADACAEIPASPIDGGSDCQPAWLANGELRKGSYFAQDLSYRCTVDVVFSDPHDLDSQFLVIFDDREINCGCGTIVESFEFKRKLIDVSYWEKNESSRWGGQITRRVLVGLNALLLGLESQTDCSAHLEITRQNLSGGSDHEIQELSFSKRFELRPCTLGTYLKVVRKRSRVEAVDLHASWTAGETCNRGGGTIVRVTFGGSDVCERCGTMSALGYQSFIGAYEGRQQGFQPRIVLCDECERRTFCTGGAGGYGDCPDGSRCVDSDEPRKGDVEKTRGRVDGVVGKEIR
jgi:hypothetical protein